MKKMRNLNREMETIKRMKKILELKSTHSETKKSLDWLNSILETAEERVEMIKIKRNYPT